MWEYKVHELTDGINDMVGSMKFFRQQSIDLQHCYKIWLISYIYSNLNVLSSNILHEYQYLLLYIGVFIIEGLRLM